MPLVKKISTEVGLLGIWKLSERSEKLEEKFNFRMEEKTEYSKIRTEKRKTEYLAARLLSKELLGFKPEIAYEPSGKPVLENSDFKISISHSAELVTVIISKKKVGIDVENTKRNIDKIAKRFLHINELNHILTLKKPHPIKALYWSAKEAIFKCTDTKSVEFKKQIIIDPFEKKSEGSFTGTLNGSIQYKLWYFFYENNVVVYCVE
ncbi:4'-phosphopantetheinyl transferase superfamily protein [Draconibacterium sp.]|nr:4'-phosphopantetheinyl transferase superfamily protein [Draconibacterium sp.]